MEKKAAQITGCSSGLGKLAARTFHAKGWNVIATMRSPEREKELTTLYNVLVTRLDVTDTKSIQKAVEEQFFACSLTNKEHRNDSKFCS